MVFKKTTLVSYVPQKEKAVHLIASFYHDISGYNIEINYQKSTPCIT